MKSELRKILADICTGQQGDQYYHTSEDDIADSDINEVLELFNKQLPEKMPLVNDRYLKGFNQCLADIRRAAGLEE